MSELTYETIQGDTWDGIAYKKLGNENYMTQLIELNSQYSNLTVFPSGIVLTLPEITAAEVKSANLPPWKR